MDARIWLFSLLFVSFLGACGADDTVNPVPEAGSDATAKDAAAEK
jgi:hypothetical protein